MEIFAPPLFPGFATSIFMAVLERFSIARTQVVTAIHGVFKNGYFSSTYTLENLCFLLITTIEPTDVMV